MQEIEEEMKVAPAGIGRSSVVVLLPMMLPNRTSTIFRFVYVIEPYKKKHFPKIKTLNHQNFVRSHYLWH